MISDERWRKRDTMLRKFLAIALLLALVVIPVAPAFAGGGGGAPGTSPKNPVCESGYYPDGTPYQICWYYDAKGNRITIQGGSYVDPYSWSVWRLITDTAKETWKYWSRGGTV